MEYIRTLAGSVTVHFAACHISSVLGIS